MKNKFIIGPFSIVKTQIGANEYRISAFKNDIFEMSFNVSLQPTGNDIELPTYQMVDKSLNVPPCIIERMKNVSDWILSDENKPDHNNKQA